MRTWQLWEELRVRGVDVIAVLEHWAFADVLVVYLHGNAGQWADGFACFMAESVPGVLEVQESERTRTILLVWCVPELNGSG